MEKTDETRATRLTTRRLCIENSCATVDNERPRGGLQMRDSVDCLSLLSGMSSHPTWRVQYHIRFCRKVSQTNTIATTHEGISGLRPRTPRNSPDPQKQSHSRGPLAMLVMAPREALSRTVHRDESLTKRGPPQKPANRWWCM